jgi:hypothetical protein
MNRTGIIRAKTAPVSLVGLSLTLSALAGEMASEQIAKAAGAASVWKPGRRSKSRDAAREMTKYMPTGCGLTEFEQSGFKSENLMAP